MGQRRFTIQNDDIEKQLNLVVSAVHELKSPLVLVQGLASMMLEGELGQLSQKQKEALGRIAMSVQRLLRLIDGLLNVSRWQQKKPSINMQPIALPALVNAVLNELAPITERRNILIKRTYGKIMPAVLGDWQLIYQVMFNLVDNALKFSPPRSAISIRFLSKPGFLHVKISDQGVGIKPKELGFLFERFSTTSVQPIEAHAASSGLGLFIVKNLVDLHGGFVSVKPLSQGTCFSVALPTTDQLPLFSEGKA